MTKQIQQGRSVPRLCSMQIISMIWMDAMAVRSIVVVVVVVLIVV